MSDDLSAIFAAMDAFVASLEDKVDQAVQGAGIETEAEAKKAAPVDTGRLRSSIQYARQEKMKCSVGTNVSYAIYQEYGTYKSPAHPFLFPAFQIASQHLIDELKNL